MSFFRWARVSGLREDDPAETLLSVPGVIGKPRPCPTGVYVVRDRIAVAAGQVSTKSTWAYCRVDINKKTYLHREARGKGAVARC